MEEGVNWSPEYCEGVKLKAPAGKEFVFNFPNGNGHVNLIGRDYKPIPLRSTIEITYRITGTGKFKSLDPAPAPPALKPNFRPMLFNGDWMDENGRWWPTGANCGWLVTDGQIHSYQILVAPKLWSNVYGKQNRDSFKACLSSMKRIYLAFGGGNSFSHGVNNGGAKFELLNLTVEKRKSGYVK